MATAQELLNNYLTTYSDPAALKADLEKRVKTINEPTISGLMRDASTLAPKAYGDFAQAFVGQGDARGMSPSARIANAQFQGAEAMNNLNQNKALRQYWGTSINDWINRLSEQMQLGQQGALQAYQLQNEAEQQAWQRAMAEKQLALQRAALNNQNRNPYNPGTPVPTKEPWRNKTLTTSGDVKDYVKGGYVDPNGTNGYTPKLQADIDYMNAWNAAGNDPFKRIGATWDYGNNQLSNWFNSLF
jgi:hypothetical protein